MNADDATTLLDRLLAAYDRRTLLQQGREMYLEQFLQWDFHVGRIAVDKLVETEDRFPSIAKLRERLNQTKATAPQRTAGSKDDEARVLTQAQCVRRRQRCTELIARKHGWETITNGRAGDKYWEPRLAECERDLDLLAETEPTVGQFDAALRNYYACLDGCGRWVKDTLRPPPASTDTSGIELIRSVIARLSGKPYPSPKVPA